jgi:hypothetical protein
MHVHLAKEKKMAIKTRESKCYKCILCRKLKLLLEKHFLWVRQNRPGVRAPNLFSTFMS